MERAQEGDHSYIHRASSLRRVSATYVANALRMPEVEALALTRGEDFQSFVRCFGEVMELDNMAVQFGFSKHPLWRQCQEEKAKSSRKVAIAARIMYSISAEDQFANLGRIAAKRKSDLATKHVGLKRWLYAQWLRGGEGIAGSCSRHRPESLGSSTIVLQDSLDVIVKFLAGLCHRRRKEGLMKLV